MKKNMEMYYDRLDSNFILSFLQKNEFSNALAYMVDFKNHRSLTVIPRDNSIEVSNKNITMIIVLFVDFKKEEFKELKNRPNLHLITFNKMVFSMVEFTGLKIKYIDNMSWFFMILARSKKKAYSDLRLLNKIEL